MDAQWQWRTDAWWPWRLLLAVLDSNARKKIDRLVMQNRPFDFDLTKKWQLRSRSSNLL